MSSLEIGILTGLGTAVGFGFSDFLAARASRQFGALYTAFWAQIIKVVFILIVFMLLGWELNVSRTAFLWAFLSGAISAAGLISGFHTFKLGPVSLASPFLSTYALIAAILSLAFLDEYLEPLQMGAVLMLITGAVLSSLNTETHRPHKGFWRQPTILFALLAASCIGAGLFFLALLAREVGWQSSTLLQSSMMLAVMSLAMLSTKTSLISQKRQPFSWSLLGAAVFAVFATIAVNFGFSSSLVAIVAPVASISPLITVGLALYFFKERLSAYQLTGALVVIIALSLLSVR